MSNQQLAKKTEPEFILDTDQAHEKELVLKNEEKSKIKVDINTLMDRVREEKKKEKKENLIFVGLIASVVLITGAIASF
tara:strand:- start:712 stop:948 length:237 start_codon:yes stop_codon:yes gene_type:complete